MDKIIFKELRAECIIGTFEHERTEKQPVIFNITLFTDLQEAGKSDDLKDTVDYFTLQQELLTFVENSSFYLLEKLVESMADLCLGYELISKVTIEVEKPMALQNVKTVALEITRTKYPSLFRNSVLKPVTSFFKNLSKKDV